MRLLLVGQVGLLAQSSSPIICEMAISRPGGPVGSVEFPYNV